MKSYEATWPDGFYHAIAKKVVIIAETKTRTRTGSCANYDISLIFSRVMCLMAFCDVDVQGIFRYELAPIPT